MTPLEFKAWFDGFSEGIDKAPTLKQWARIKERVAEIDGRPVTEKIFVDRYLPRYLPHYYRCRTEWSTPRGSSQVNLVSRSHCEAMPFNALAVMNALGRSEINELT